MTARTYGFLLAAGLLTASQILSQSAKTPPATDWAYGGGAEGTRYSPLKQINRQNVAKLREVWRFDVTPPTAPEPGRGGLQTQPLVIKGVLYGNTPAGAVFAVDAVTGK